jgi:subtilase family serine protease
MAEQQDKNSANYHRWLSSAEFGEKFGAAPADIEVVTRWLTSKGFEINLVYSGGMVIDFSGTAGQLRDAFQTELHNLVVHGVRHVANIRHPQIPAALAPAVVGIASLHDFLPRPMYKPRPNYTAANSSLLAVVPAALATIYNLNPLFKAGYSGKGQTVVVIENTNVYSTADWTTFRTAFGLSTYTTGTFTQVHPAPPTGPSNCANPGVNGDDGEAILDAEYASAAIELASCADTQTTFGGLIAVQNIINAKTTPPAIISISYGECEAYNGATANAAYNAIFEQAAAEGVSVFVSSGDEGAASCDAAKATHGINVSGFASTPYNVAVGGTDFGDSYAGSTSAYWNSTNTSAFGSAKSYIPEIPWNDSCAGSLLSSYEGYLRLRWLLQQLRRRRLFPSHRLRQRRPKQLRHRRRLHQRRRQRHVQGLRQAHMAIPRRRSLRRRPRHSRHFPLCRQRPLGPLLRVLLFGPEEWRSSLHWRAE